MIIPYVLKQENEKWWSASAKVPWYALFLKGMGGSREEAETRVKQIVISSRPMGELYKELTFEEVPEVTSDFKLEPADFDEIKQSDAKIETLDLLDPDGELYKELETARKLYHEANTGRITALNDLVWCLRRLQNPNRYTQEESDHLLELALQYSVKP